MNWMRRWLVALLVTLAASSAFAQPLPAQPDDAQVAAREVFRRASAAGEAGDWVAALSLYQEAQRRFPHATTLYNIGYCHEQLGDDLAAFRETLAALSLTRTTPDRGLNAERHARARAALENLRARLAEVRLEPTESDVTIGLIGSALRAIDDEHTVVLVPEEHATERELKLNAPSRLVLRPGDHAIHWRSAATVGSQTVHVTAGASLPLALPPPRQAATPETPVTAAPPAASATAPKEPTPAPPPRLRPPPPPATRQDRPLRTWGITSLVVGSTALGVGTTAGLIALTTKNDLDERCQADGRCSEAERGRLQRFEVATTTANVAFAVAAVGGAAGLTLLLLDQRATHAAHVPTLSLHSSVNEVRLQGTF